jgi:UDP-glucose 4-epimerase
LPVVSERRVAVTGASGFVGLNVVEWLLTAGLEAVAVDTTEVPAVARADFARLPGSLHDAVADVTDPAAMTEAMAGADVVIHGAAITAGTARERIGARRVVEVNVLGTQTVLDALAEAATVRRVVFVSSGAVYGDRAFGSNPIDEATPPEPSSLYAITKLTGEQLVRRHGMVHDTEVVIARLSAVFGPWERDTGVRDSISPMYRLARARRSGVRVAVESHTRNWLYSRDAAVALCELALSPHPDHDLYNITPTEWCEPLQWARHIGVDLADTEHDDARRAELEAGTGRAPVSNDRIREELPGWPAHGPAEAFDDYAAWLDRHRSLG